MVVAISGGVLTAAFIPGLLVAYGRRRVYSIRIEDDRLLLKAPLRTRRVLLQELRAADVISGSARQTRWVVIKTTDGRRFTIPTGKRSDLNRIASMCDRVAEVVPTFDYTAVRAHAARGR